VDNSGEATDSASGLRQNPMDSVRWFSPIESPSILEVQSPFLVRVYHHPTSREIFHDFSTHFCVQEAGFSDAFLMHMMHAKCIM